LSFFDEGDAMTLRILLAMTLLGLGAPNGGCLPAPRPDSVDPCEPVIYKISMVWSPAWSPDGRQVAFESARDQRGALSPGIYINNLADGRSRKVYDDPSYVTSISWSTSQNAILLQRGFYLSLLDLASGGERPMNVLGRDMSGAVWSWEGDSIYYTRGYTSDYLNQNPPDSIGLFVMPASGGPGRRFVPSDGSLIYPLGSVDFSPGGEWLAFVQPNPDSAGTPQPGGEIYMVRRDGTDLTQVTHLRGYPHNPRWVEGGRAIIFDYWPKECASVPGVVGHTWIVRPGVSRPRRYFTDIGDRRIQFGFPPAIDRTGRWAAVPLLDPKTGYGALYLMDVFGGHKRLLHPLTVQPFAASQLSRNPRFGH
jgi:dipeptidyl aminopeptidase/acylaminoacyl peptidase